LCANIRACSAVFEKEKILNTIKKNIAKEANMISKEGSLSLFLSKEGSHSKHQDWRSEKGVF